MARPQVDTTYLNEIIGEILEDRKPDNRALAYAVALGAKALREPTGNEDSDEIARVRLNVAALVLGDAALADVLEELSYLLGLCMTQPEAKEPDTQAPTADPFDDEFLGGEPPATTASATAAKPAPSSGSGAAANASGPASSAATPAAGPTARGRRSGRRQVPADRSV